MLSLLLALALPAVAANVRTAPLPPYLSVANVSDRAYVASVVQAAQASPTARGVLKQVELAAAAAGRPLVVEVARSEESGSYNMDWHAVTLRRADMKHGPLQSAPTIIHELKHMLQRNFWVPSDLLETELEAYVVDFRVHQELGLKPRKDSYDEKAQRAFKRGLTPFLGFLSREYPEDKLLHGRSADAYAAEIRSDLAKLEKERAETRSELAERRRVLDQLQGRQRAYYEADVIAPLKAKLGDLKRAAEYSRSDLRQMLSPEGRAAARAYVRNVIRKARRFTL